MLHSKPIGSLGYGGGVGVLLDIPLLDSIAIARGITPFTPPSVGDADGNRYVLDNEHVYRATLAEEVRFKGARRVENLAPASEDLTSGDWGADVQANSSETATTIELTGTNNSYHYKQITLPTDIANRSFIVRAKAQWISGATSVGFRTVATQEDVAVIDLSDGEEHEVTLAFTNTAAGTAFFFGIDNRTAVIAGVDTAPTKVTFTNIQIEESTGRIDTTTPSEYVSVGVLSSPFHGANVDGVQYFTTTNGNSVASNVVTEGTGTALDTELISNSGYSGTIGNGSNFVNTDGWTASGSTLSVASGELVVTNSGAANGEARQSFTTVANQIYTLFYDFNYDSIAGQVEVGTSAGSNALYDSGDLTADTVKRVTFKASGTTTHISLITSTATATNATDWKAISIVASRPTYFAEGAATNLINQPRDLTHADWVETGTSVAALDETGIDGQPNSATTLTDNDGAGFELVAETVVITDDSNPVLFTVFIKKDSDETRFASMATQLTAGTTQTLNIDINTKTGDTAQRTTAGAGAQAFSDPCIDMGDWWLCWAKLTNVGDGNVNATMQLFPAVGTTIGTAAAAATGSAIFDSATIIENQSYPTTPLLNTGGHARLADVGATLDLANWPDTHGSLEFDFTPEYDIAPSGAWGVISPNSANTSSHLYNQDTKDLRLNDGITALVHGSAWSVTGQTVHVKTRWNATTSKMNISVDGTPSTAVAFDGSFGAATSIMLLKSFGLGAGIKNLKTYSTDKGESWLAQ